MTVERYNPREKEPHWQKVWERFKEAPGRYQHLPDWLRKAKSGPSRDC